MAHHLYRATLALQTPFGTPLAGDTLFGQLCWALRETQGEAEIIRRLQGYTQGQPWLVVSDGFPTGYLPKPTLPQHFEPIASPEERKAAKKRRWIPCCGSSAHFLQNFAQLLRSAVDDKTVYGDNRQPQKEMQAHNTLNRLTGTTGSGEFAPFTQPLTYYASGQNIDLYLVLDDERVSASEVRQLLTHIGLTGFGRDASTGLGKFHLQDLQTVHFAPPAQTNAYWTLGPCAPQNLGFNAEHSYYRVLTRFGRHGNAHALAGKPFKTPLLLAATGAVFGLVAPTPPVCLIGQGLGGKGRLSKAEEATVHQGYAPALPICLPETKS